MRAIMLVASRLINLNRTSPCGTQRKCLPGGDAPEALRSHFAPFKFVNQNRDHGDQREPAANRIPGARGTIATERLQRNLPRRSQA